MTEVYLKYNPYKVETQIWIDGEEIGEDSQLYAFRKDRLQVWLDQLVDILMEEVNEPEFKLVFHGTTFDYEDVVAECTKHNSMGSSRITLAHVPAENTEDKISELRDLVEHMMQGPFEELRSEGIRKNFEKALSSEFEIAVIATVSSGKSTLINALLGQELMPSKNAACTATIVSIKMSIIAKSLSLGV